MLRVRVKISLFDGAPGLSTYYFGTPLEDNDAAVRCINHVHGLYAGVVANLSPLGTEFTLDPNVDVITAATGVTTATIITAPTAVVTSTASPNRAAPAVALLMQLRTSTFVAGRNIRGKTYISPLIAGAVSNLGTADETLRAALESSWTALPAAMAAGDTWVVWHRPKAGAGGSEAPIVSVTVPSKLAVLRSRRD